MFKVKNELINYKRHLKDSLKQFTRIKSAVDISPDKDVWIILKSIAKMRGKEKKTGYS